MFGLFSATMAETMVMASTNCSNTYNPKDADVYLHVPNLSVQSISLIVEKLNVSLDLDLKVASLVQLSAGVSATIEEVNLTITGVKAEVELIVHLDNVVTIVGETLKTINNNPQLVTGLLNAITEIVGSITGVLSQTVNSLGEIVKTVVDSAGNIVSQTLNQAGNVVSSSKLGNLSSFPIISSVTNSAGQLVNKLQAPDGSIIQAIYDKAGGTIQTVTVLAAQGSTSTSSSSTTSN